MIRQQCYKGEEQKEVRQEHSKVATLHSSEHVHYKEFYSVSYRNNKQNTKYKVKLVQTVHKPKKTFQLLPVKKTAVSHEICLHCTNAVQKSNAIVIPLKLQFCLLYIQVTVFVVRP